jgi:hypothetical protein
MAESDSRNTSAARPGYHVEHEQRNVLATHFIGFPMDFIGCSWEIMRILWDLFRC